MKTVYVGGPRHEAWLDVRPFYSDIAQFCEMDGHRVLLPTDDVEYKTESDFSREIRSRIKGSTHVLLVPFAAFSEGSDVAVGIEAEYAHHLRKPIGVWWTPWHRENSHRSKMLMAIANLESKTEEGVTVFLKRFLKECDSASAH